MGALATLLAPSTALEAAVPTARALQFVFPVLRDKRADALRYEAQFVDLCAELRTELAGPGPQGRAPITFTYHAESSYQVETDRGLSADQSFVVFRYQGPRR